VSELMASRWHACAGDQGDLAGFEFHDLSDMAALTSLTELQINLANGEPSRHGASRTQCMSEYG